MDIEDLQATYYDTLRMAGKVKIRSENAVLWTQVESDRIYEYGKDGLRQIPGTIMFSNGISWVYIISLNLVSNRRDEYILEKMSVQPGILDLLKLDWESGEMYAVQEFYSFISKSEVNQESGLVDSTSTAMNMIAMGVQTTKLY